MKKYILLVFILITSFQLLAQLEVKEGSFKKSEGFININPDIQSDDNDVLYAVVKVKTENINDKQRHELSFEGNAATFIEIEYKIGEVWVYLSSKHATYLKISHPDFSSTEFWFPCDLEPKQGYELILTNNAKETNGYGSLEITTNTITDATISINGKIMSYKTPHTFDFFPAGTYDIVVSKEKYKTTRRTITVKSGEKMKIDIQMPVAFGVLSINTKPTDADIYLDGKLCGQTPLSTKITAEKHKIKILKDGYKSLIFDDVIIKEDESFIIDTVLIETFDIKINTNGRFDKLYVDGQYEGYSPITRQLSPGTHIIKIERGYRDDEVFEKVIVIEPNGQKVFNLILDSKLNITTNREASIFVDNKRIGNSPQSLDLPIGNHHIKAIHNEKEVDTIIDLVQGEEYDLYLSIPKSREDRTFRFDLGVFAGLGFNMISGSVSKKATTSFSKGLYITAKIHRLGIKIEYTGSNYSCQEVYYSHEYPQTSSVYAYEYNYMFSTKSIPIMIGYELDDGILFSIYLGPQINKCSSATYDIREHIYNTILQGRQSIKNYEKTSCNLVGEISVGYSFKHISVSFLTFKFDITKASLINNNGTEIFHGDLGYRSTVFAMQFDYNF